MWDAKQLQSFLNEKASFYERPEFIERDPISIPHQFTLKQDIEIAGFFAAIFSWGQRATILKKGNELMTGMEGQPYEFIRHHSEKDLKRFRQFKHRTFQPDDLWVLITFLKTVYNAHQSLEQVFLHQSNFISIEDSLTRFYTGIFSSSFALDRTKKHISTPAKHSSCKRLCMFLRWMVRSNRHGVDFGIWKNIPIHALICPLDIHVSRVAVKLGLLDNPSSNWKQALHLTEQLCSFDAEDPVKYDFALFNLGIEEHWK